MRPSARRAASASAERIAVTSSSTCSSVVPANISRNRSRSASFTHGSKRRSAIRRHHEVPLVGDHPHRFLRSRIEARTVVEEDDDGERPVAVRLLDVDPILHGADGTVPAIEATVASDESYILGEGPFWDAPRRRLLWVDILGGNVHEGVLDGDRVRPTTSHPFGERVGAVVAAGDGTLLVAAERTLVVVHPDGRRDVRAQIVPDGVRRHLNDGGTDPAGRFLVGTLSWAGPSETEELVRLEPDGRITLIDDDIRLSNGLAWSADGRTMYSTDSKRTTIFTRPYDPATGAVGARRPHLTVEGEGVDPDGMAIDADGHLWIAIWGGSEVRRYSPDGRVVDRIAAPAPHTTSVAFAGDDLRTLVITTATLDLTDDELRANPLSGRLFTARVDVAGQPVPAWSGAKRPGWFARRWRGRKRFP